MPHGKTDLYPQTAILAPGRTPQESPHVAVRQITLLPSENGVRVADGYSIVIHRGKPAPLEWTATARTTRRIFRRGEITLHVPGELPAFRLHEPAEVLEVALSARFMADTFGDVLSARNTQNRYGFCDTQVEPIARALEADLGEGSPNGVFFAGGLAIALAARLFLPRHVHPPEYAKLGGRDVRRVRDFVRAHLRDELTVDKLAALTAYSPHHFSLLFKSATGLTPYQFVIRERVYAAADFLCDSRDTLVQIALCVGFASQSHLHAHFKRIYGVTPREYRNAARN